MENVLTASYLLLCLTDHVIIFAVSLQEHIYYLENVKMDLYLLIKISNQIKVNFE